MNPRSPALIAAALATLAACSGSGARAIETVPGTSSDPTAEVVSPPDALTRLAARGLMVPVHGLGPAAVRNTYSAGRDAGRTHAAIDLIAPKGTPVVSADSGVVWKVRTNALGGRTIYVHDHAREFVHYYAHLDRYLPGLHEGQRVGPGDIIGYVGTTGNAPANQPHLHYQLLRYPVSGRWWEGEPLNPFPLFRVEGRAASR